MKNKSYILNPKNIREKDFELVGREAIEYSLILKENIPTPQNFVITSITFDDFLTSASLIEPIGKSLKNVRPFIRETALKASEEISNYILSANFPTIISDPINFVYQNLTSINDQPLVSMFASNIIDEKFISPANIHPPEIIIKGIADILFNIKLSWANLFSADAIEFRANNYYRGPLSLAIIVQKKVRSEISGKAITVPSAKDQEQIVEIKAAYGINPNEKDYDIYKVNKETNKVLEKNIIPQETMFVRKLKIEKGQDPNMKVEISELWKKHPKLDDNKILLLNQYTNKAEKLFNCPVELTWAIEAGDIYIMEMRSLEVIEPDKKVLKTDLTLKDKENIIQIEVNKPKPDLDKLTREVEAIANNISINEQIEETSTIKESNILLPLIENEKTDKNDKLNYLEDFDFLTSIYLDISLMNSRSLSAAKHFSGSFFDATEMILNNNLLPEEFKDNSIKLNELIEKYALDISTASMIDTQKPFIYQFSTISEYELKLLGLEDNRYKYNYDERFIDYPESLLVEALSIKKARNQFGIRNIKICFSGIRNLSNLNDLKKVVASQGIKKTNIFKYYCEVTVPSFIFDIDRLEANEIDGLIVNYTKLLKLTTFRTDLRSSDQQIGIKQLELIKNLSLEKNLEFFVRLDVYNKELIQHVIKLKPTGIIFSILPDQDTLRIIQEMESQK